MPEWYLITAVLGGLTLLGLSWPPLLWVAPLFLLGLAAPVAQAVLSAARAEFPTPRPDPVQRLGLRALTALLHLMQPLARLIGRLRHGLTPWRERSDSRPHWRWRLEEALWSEQWRAPESWLHGIQQRLHQSSPAVSAGGDFDDWDLQLRGGLLAGARAVMAIEEHGAGHQMVRFRVSPVVSRPAAVLVGVIALLAVAALADGAWLAGGVMIGAVVALSARALREYAVSAGGLSAAIRDEGTGDPVQP